LTLPLMSNALILLEIPASPPKWGRGQVEN